MFNFGRVDRPLEVVVPGAWASNAPLIQEKQAWSEWDTILWGQGIYHSNLCVVELVESSWKIPDICAICNICPICTHVGVLKNLGIVTQPAARLQHPVCQVKESTHGCIGHTPHQGPTCITWSFWATSVRLPETNKWKKWQKVTLCTCLFLFDPFRSSLGTL